jgi:cytochrome b involved in lipid metabolism
MGTLGLSLIFASVVYVLLVPTGWLPSVLHTLRQLRPPPPPTLDDSRHEDPEPDGREGVADKGKAPRIQLQPFDDEKTRENGSSSQPSIVLGSTSTAPKSAKDVRDRAAMPPPPPVIRRPNAKVSETIDSQSDGNTTPKAVAAQSRDNVPSFSLSGDSASQAVSSGVNLLTSSLSAASMGPPPPRLPQQSRLPAFPALNSAQRARGPVPDRGPPAGSLAPPSLAPPPTHSTKPSKPSRKVILTPGHSPLDWARISGPNSDLRNLPASTPYLKVTLSMLKHYTGRKGKDAWTAIGGRVYNITPYLPYHPGGEPELLRCAGRDGTKLFGEIHPWVNYETMLAACLVGLLVDEEENSKTSEMDNMD